MATFSAMDIQEIVKKLIGPISPIGDSNADEVRFTNLKTMSDLVDGLVYDLASISNTYSNSHEYSVKRSGEFADKFLRDLAESLD